MSYPEYYYRLVKINQSQPLPANEQDILNPPFRFEFEHKNVKDGTMLIVKSNTFFDLDGAKVIVGESHYFLGMEQPISALNQQKFITAELLYQHICRQTSLVYNISKAQILLNAPTLHEILHEINLYAE